MDPFICFKKHGHDTREGALKCNAKYARKSADRKLARFGYRPPKKTARIYWPGKPDKIGTLDIIRFSGDDIVRYK